MANTKINPEQLGFKKTVETFDTDTFVHNVREGYDVAVRVYDDEKLGVHIFNAYGDSHRTVYRGKCNSIADLKMFLNCVNIEDCAKTQLGVI